MTISAATTWSGPATWFRPLRPCSPAAVSTLPAAPLSTSPAPSGRMAALPRTSGSTADPIGTAFSSMKSPSRSSSPGASGRPAASATGMSFPFVERAAGFLVRNAPITHQERWEENSGYSPSTLAAVIGGLICAAEIARDHQSVELGIFLEEYADWIESHLEDWTVTNDGVLLPGVKRHYMRVRPPETGEAVDKEGPGTETIHLNNRPPGTPHEFEARQIIDGGFLELVRYGIRNADDPPHGRFTQSCRCCTQKRPSARSRLAALQLGWLWPARRRRPLRGFRPGPRLAPADRRTRPLRDCCRTRSLRPDQDLRTLRNRWQHASRAGLGRANGSRKPPRLWGSGRLCLPARLGACRVF